MSYYETREQRQIRELQRQFRATTQENAARRRAQADLDRRIRQNEAERRRTESRLQDSISRQQRQLQEQERENRRLGASIQALDQEIIAQERIHTEQFQQMRRQHSQDIRQTNERITRVSQQLQGQITQTRNELEGQISSLRTHTDQQLSAIRQQRERDIAWTRQQFENTNSRITSLEQTIENHHELSEYWISQAQRMIAEIRDSLHPERESQHWEQLQQTLQNAISDLNSGAFQSAISNGRNAYQDAYALRDILIAHELEWQQTLEAVRQSETALLENLVQAQGRTYTFELDGEQVTEDRGVDYWTYGQFSVLIDRINEARNQLNNNTDSLSIEQLQRYLQQMTELLAELSLLENAAAANLSMAQGRYNMAERIGRVLGDQFLMVDSDGDYFAQENRDEYHAVFRNNTTGEEVVVTITPLVGEDGVVVNHAELIVGVPTNSKEDRERINDAVVSSVAREVPDFKLPCSGQYGENTNAEAQRTGNISAVSDGEEQARTQCSRTGVSHQGITLTNPVTRVSSAKEASSGLKQQE